MKTCPKCSSTTFDDMDICYECMNPFVEIKAASKNEAGDDSSDTKVARLKVVLAEYFSYEMLLTKSDGRSLSVGSAADNAIVIPQPEVAAHQLDIFFARGQLWVETAAMETEFLADGNPITDTRCLNANTPIQVGDAKITLLEE